MLRKILNLLASAAVCICLLGCSGENETPIYETDKKNTADSPSIQTNEPAEIDLSQFNKQMTYAEILGLHMSPEEYLGKVIKLKGIFDRYCEVDESRNPIQEKMHLGIIVSDAMGCCSLPLDFVLAVDKELDDLPELGTEITVSGKVTQYEKPWGAMFYLNDAEIWN